MDSIVYLQKLSFNSSMIAGNLPHLQEIAKVLLACDALQWKFNNSCSCLIKTEELAGITASCGFASTN